MLSLKMDLEVGATTFEKILDTYGVSGIVVDQGGGIVTRESHLEV